MKQLAARARGQGAVAFRVAGFIAGMMLFDGSQTFAQGTFDYVVNAVLRTQQGETLASDTQEFPVGPVLHNGNLEFAFGFATQEQVVPGVFLDSATITIQDLSRAYTLVVLTADANGVQWAPVTPGAAFLDPSLVQRTSIPMNDTSLPWNWQAAYWVSVPIQPFPLGTPLDISIDLFNNQNSLQSMTWMSQIPEPGAGALLGLALLLRAIRRGNKS